MLGVEATIHHGMKVKSLRIYHSHKNGKFNFYIKKPTSVFFYLTFLKLLLQVFCLVPGINYYET